MMTLREIHDKYNIPFEDIEAVIHDTTTTETKGCKTLYDKNEIICLVRQRYKAIAERFADEARRLNLFIEG